ncbi:GNAT family N-acetyltransferase [Mariniflexile ostreae]|uniref:GNAT family N-acetyltransferase n=1 Tax=Mariniflexile ostreae TaxID=1520892 RepID=A0ABV5FEW1_9FLAO
MSENSGEFGDGKSAVKKSLLYASKEIPGLGGFVFTMEHKTEIVGALVVNKTGMNEYMSENILVNIAVKKSYRGRGIAKELITYMIKYCKGDISLHINENNPVVELFKNRGFKPKNIEMILER